jgi:hypothetical protein
LPTTIGEDLETLRALKKFFIGNYPRVEKLLKPDNERVQKQTSYEKLKYLSTYQKVDI